MCGIEGEAFLSHHGLDASIRMISTGSPGPSADAAVEAYLQGLDEALYEQKPVGVTDASLRALGAREGNNAHIIADRMKGKGRRWSRRGALPMAKVKELVADANSGPGVALSGHLVLNL